MHPVLFYIGDRPIYTYGVSVGLIVILVHWLLLRRNSRSPILSKGDVRAITLMLLLVMWLSQGIPRLPSRTAEHDGDAAHYVAQILLSIPLSGVLTLLLLLLLVLYCGVKRLPLLRVLDLVVPYFVLAYALHRGLGCFLAGCCYGTPTTVSWGIRFPEAPAGPVPGIEVHPTQIYLAVTALAVYSVVRVLEANKRPSGITTAVGTIGVFGSYFLITFYRGDLNGEELVLGLSASQFFPLLLVSGGLLTILFLVVRERRPRAERQPA